MTKLIDLTVDRKGHYGIGASSCSYRKEYPEYLRITDISDDGRVIRPLSTSIDIYEYPSYKDYYLNKNDIVFARTGNSTGRNYFYEGDNNKIVYAGFLIKYSLDESLVVPKYVSYYCQSKKFYDVINGNSNGSTRKNFNAKSFGDIEIPMVEHKLQQHIVDIIGSIDDLIEKYGENIEKLLYKGDIEIQRIYDSESYHKEKLLDCLSLLKDGTHNPPKRIEKGIPLLTGQNIDNGFISHKDITYVSLEDYNKIHSKYAPVIGDLVITKIGTVGKVAVLRKQDIPMTIHCNSALLRFKSIHYSTAFFVMNSLDFQNEFHSHKNQTVQEFINLEQLGNLNIKIPKCDETIFDNLFELISHYKDIIDELSTLKQLYLNKFFN